MKIALAFNEKDFESNLHTLEIRKYDIGRSSSLYTIWVYGLKTVEYKTDYIQITKKEDFSSTRIYLKELEYFEVHEGEK